MKLDPKSLRLISVYQTDDRGTLYDLLQERTKNINISHQEMPTWEDHLRFVASKPYLAWYYIVVDGTNNDITVPIKVGAIYLTVKDEVGLFIFKKYMKNGFGEAALRTLKQLWPGVNKFYANINPKNEKSIRFFTKMGFKPLQHTFVLESPKKVRA